MKSLEQRQAELERDRLKFTPERLLELTKQLNRDRAMYLQQKHYGGK
jgi:hypothetical protein